MSNPVTTQSEQPTFTMGGLWKALSISQVWSIGSALAGLVAGAVVVGGYVQSVRGERELSNLAATNNSLASTNSSLTAKIAELERALTASGALSRNSDAKIQELRGEIEFLNRFVSYEVVRNDTSKMLFVNTVCVLWRDAESRRLRVVSAPIELSSAEIQRGLSPQMKELLVHYGVSAAELDRAAGSPTGEGLADVQRAVANVQKQTSGIDIKKTVTFADGLSFEIPAEIALIVHSKPDCGPR